MATVLEQNHLKTAAEIAADHRDTIDLLKIYQRASNYLSAAQIYLQDNVLLHKPLTADDIKPRLLGHWGTCPGINLIYAHLNRLIIQKNIDMFLVTGPGHGAPAVLANLFLEGSLQVYYPEMAEGMPGLKQFIKGFSWPDGFPSHVYPGLPGTIHEGGELGYALATSFGAILDNPDLIVVCIVGDGEAETGPTATAWHSPKFIDPAESGAVLPIVHINGYKISSPTIYGTMHDQELTDLFHGYGYQPCIVSGGDLDASLFAAVDWAYEQIRTIQTAARTGHSLDCPRWPVILLRSLKGMGGVKELDGELIEGTYRSHQVPVKDAKTNPKHLKILEEWLRSYEPEKLFDQTGKPVDQIAKMAPKGDKRMGLNPHTFGGRMLKELIRNSVYDYEIVLERNNKELIRGSKKAGNTGSIVPLLEDIIRQIPITFAYFHPMNWNRINLVFSGLRIGIINGL